MLAVGGVRQIDLLRNSKNCLRKYFFYSYISLPFIGVISILITNTRNFFAFLVLVPILYIRRSVRVFWWFWERQKWREEVKSPLASFLLYSWWVYTMVESCITRCNATNDNNTSPMHPWLSRRAISGSAGRQAWHVGSSCVVCATGGGGAAAILSIVCSVDQFNAIKSVNYRRWRVGIVRKLLFWEVRVVIKHKHKITKVAFAAKCALELFIARTLSQTPRPLYHWKADSLGFPKNNNIKGLLWAVY
jgi:hypothetical protein